MLHPNRLRNILYNNLAPKSTVFGCVDQCIFKYLPETAIQAALRNRKAIAETRRNYALIAQAFQNSATALASAATSPE
jgi:hypothetical protein